MIEVQNIKKAFNGKEVLKGISGKFMQGKTNLIIGSSGTGKSVLLKNIVGLVAPDEGNVFYDGRNFTHGDDELRKDIRRELGMLFQGSALFDSKTVLENVRFPLDMLTNTNKEEKLERVNFCLQRVGLENVNHLKPSEISGGMQKRVGIARAMVLNPKYLFVDEPNSGLDVTHDMNSVMGIGDYIMYLNKGLKLWEGTSETILETEVVELQDFIFSSRLVRSLKEQKKVI